MAEALSPVCQGVSPSALFVDHAVGNAPPRPSKFSDAHQRQLAVYSKAFPDKELWCDYVTKKEAISFKVQNVEQRLNEVIKIAFGLQKFLSISDDPFELASILYPNYDDWRWNEEMKKQSTKIWSNK